MKTYAQLDKNTVEAHNQLQNLEFVHFLHEKGKGPKILFVGNSISLHEEKPEIGWNCSWGMAASSPDKDYVHLVLKDLEAVYPEVSGCICQVARWEWNYKQGSDTFQLYEKARNYDADIIVMRAVENCPKQDFDNNVFKKALEELLNFLNPSGRARIIMTTGFWYHPGDKGIEELAHEKQWELIALGDLGERDEMKAIGRFEHAGVANHPGDLGMRVIAERISRQIMKNHLQNGTWIWCNSNPKEDEYAEFIDHFTYESGIVKMQISADSNYAVYINGELAVWGQYADYPYDKIYDEVDVTSYCQKGENRVAMIVWYYGIDTTQVYYPGNAGLLYAILCGDEVLCKSNDQTLSRESKAYMNHRMHIITGQLGLGFGYDATKEDDWKTGEATDFTPSVKVEQDLPLRIRPCDKLTLLPEVVGVQSKKITATDIIFDLGSEQVGFLSLKLLSSCAQDITISFGEHLVDGCVRRCIDSRDFSVHYRASEGENEYLNPFRRLGCRYLEVQSEYPLEIEKMAIAPTMYVLKEKERPVLNQKQNKIYDMCVDTLHLCMHEHYEDCPWREQALYTMDSRNQMLCGYYVFGEYKFPRSNLQLISKDNREDGFLSICYPMQLDLVIPSFSLHYITACREYLQYSEDSAFLQEIYPKLESILNTFISQITNGLLYPFPGVTHWNFYEWRDGLDGGGPYCEDFDCSKPDVLLNSLLSIALQNMGFIADNLNIANTYQQQAEMLNKHIYNVFYNPNTQLCYDYPEHKAYSQLGNSLAILCGAVKASDAAVICEKLFTDEEMTPVSLSMLCFKYDACLKIDKKHYAPLVLKDIEKIYTPMIEFGSTTVWETELGESDFDNAGSLCHGWSALPIYYYHILSK